MSGRKASEVSSVLNRANKSRNVFDENITRGLNILKEKIVEYGREFFIVEGMSISEFSIDAVPTSTGCPFSCASFISSITALNLESSVLYIISLLSFLITGKFVGIVTTSRLYISLNSLSSVIAVPVIPANLSYILKKFWNVIVASVFDSSAILTCSLASIAWCNPVRISSSFHYTSCKFINY